MYDSHPSDLGTRAELSPPKTLRLTQSPFIEILITAGVLVIAIALLMAIHLRGGDVAVALSDPATYAGGPFFLGAISNGGIVVLIIAATTTMMATALRAPRARLLGWVSLLSALLALDDLFLLHDGPIRDLLPWFEMVMFALYGCAATAILWMQRAYLAQVRHLPLVLSVLCLALSVTLDAMPAAIAVPNATEDLCKFAGFLLWSSYWSKLSFEAITLRF
ncbi:hypothetical protein [uncultured Roseobacter sp.]|uniref:hypothetical protein n=1 Tax=uncultured Roseobacter sp. TaxID=114847 RepID=UPI002613677E|nr:hypothetical protein [uncultured Roseobacter sp.]